MAGDGSDKVWVCMVCGYIHRGPEPPEECPVCGCPGSDFELQAGVASPAPAPPAATRTRPKRWRCIICGYVHEGDVPPDFCRICGADADQFELLEEAAPVESPASKSLRVVIVGGGIAGVAAAEAVRQYAANAEITLVSREAGLPYYRLNLTRLLAGEIDEAALPIHPEAWYEEQKIQLLPGKSAAAILPDKQTVTLNDGSTLPYDKLILACGASPFIPPIPGAALPGVTVVRTVSDVRNILAAVTPGMPCVCIGGGILGLEIAGGLARRGARVTILESESWLLPRQLNQAAARMLERHVATLGVTVLFNAKTAELTGAGCVQEVRLADGTSLPADLAVIATGVRPNNDLARAAGLKVNLGVVVDDRLATSQPNIHAAGDLAEHRDVLYGLWDPARHQGAIAGMNAAGTPAEFGGMPRANALKALGLGLFSIGVVDAAGEAIVEAAEEKDGAYFRFLFQDSRLVGAILVGDTSLAAAAAKAIKTGAGLDAAVPATFSAVAEWLAALP